MNYIIWIFAGSLMLICVWLAQVVSQWWLLPIVSVGGFLVVSGFTGHYPLTETLKKKLRNRNSGKRGE
jgi:hypothetical protein